MSDQMGEAKAAQTAPAAAGVSAPDIQAALQLFDETTRALEARSRRLEEVLTVKQMELVAANQALADKVSELDSLHAYVNLVLASVASGVIAVDKDGRITTCNPAARLALAGLLPEDPVGADYRQLAPEAECWAVLDSGEAVGPYERRCPGFDGRQRTLAGRASPVCDADGSLIGLVEVFQDVTDLRRLEAELERAERLKALGEMAAGVAHEIRNPLNGIEGFASLLSRDLPEDGKPKKYADAIIDGVRHLNHTVTGLLEFTSPKPPQRRPMPVVELTSSCVDLVRSEFGDRISVQLSNDWGAEKLACDGTQVRQVLLNIIQNACQILVQHDIPEPRVQVAMTASEHDGHPCCLWRVDDNGPGVPSENRQHIFTPFHTSRASGTGLGLAVAHTLVDLHGGALWVEDAPTGGARFSIAIPVD